MAETPASTHVKRIAITMDDFNQNFDIGLSLAARNQNILAAFDAVNHKAAGFVTGSFVDTSWGKAVLSSWREGGHLIENHTWSHTHANETTSFSYLADIDRNSEFLAAQGFASEYFRFPFLDDGKDRATQEALFAGLKFAGLLNAPVTFDTVDWYTSSRLEARLREDPNTDLTPYRDYYVNMCVRLANHWDNAAQALGYINLPHLTLMHHNILNGLFLKDVLLALKDDGWAFVDARDALSMKSYHDVPPEPTNGRNWLTLKRLESGLDLAPYPQKYSNFGRATMDALGL
ncbi:polysaccharide deacetylase family protein [Litorimonas cladophorae]|nr:polysaccharide deacetylase family protein [Litorimonas cladophorae]